jgi:hypothetical protein
MDHRGVLVDGREKVGLVQARHAFAKQVLVQQVALIQQEIAADGSFAEVAIADKLHAPDMKRRAPLDGSSQVGFRRFFRAGLGGLHLHVYGEVQNAIVLGLAACHKQGGAKVLIPHQAVERMNHLGRYSIARDLPGWHVIHLPGLHLNADVRRLLGHLHIIQLHRGVEIAPRYVIGPQQS